MLSCSPFCQSSRCHTELSSAAANFFDLGLQDGLEVLGRADRTHLVLDPLQRGRPALHFPLPPAAELLLQFPELAPGLVQVGRQALHLAVEEILIEGDHDRMRPAENLLFCTVDFDAVQAQRG